MPDIDTDALLDPGEVLRENAGGTALEGASPSTIVAEAYQVVNAQTGTTYTLVLTDVNKQVSLTNAAAITLTVPTNATVAFPLQTRIDLVQLGAGQVTVSPAGGVTIGVAKDDGGVELFVRKLSGQYAEAGLVKQGTNLWVLTGVLEAV
jgi:hypothetical protein